MAVAPASFNSLPEAIVQLLTEAVSHVVPRLIVLTPARLVTALVNARVFPVRSKPPLLKVNHGTDNPSMLLMFAGRVVPLKINLSPSAGASPLSQLPPVDQLASAPPPFQV